MIHERCAYSWGWFLSKNPGQRPGLLLVICKFCHNLMSKGQLRITQKSAIYAKILLFVQLTFVSFWQYFPHSSDCFPHSFSSQEFGKTSLWNKYHSLPCDFGKFVGKTHHSCKFLGHSRPNGLSWPKNLHSLWVFSSLIFPRSRSREMINVTSPKSVVMKRQTGDLDMP